MTRQDHPAQPLAERLNLIMAEGLSLHQRGRLAEAARIYEAVLAEEPNHFAALHSCALVAYQSGQLPQAAEFFAKALRANPDVAAAHSNFGMALQDMKRREDAMAAYDRAIALKPDYARAYYNRASLFQELERYDAAVADYDAAIAITPDYHDALNNRGIAFQKLDRHDQALASFDHAIALRPDFAEAFYNRGNALQSLDRFEDAVASYSRALDLRADYAEAFCRRADAFQNLTRFDEAIADYDRTIALKPDYVIAYYNRGVCLQKLERFEEALVCYDEALKIAPDYVDALNNRGNALQSLKRHDEALASYEQAIRIKPDYAKAWFNHGAVLQVMHKFDDALASYEKAVAIDPDHLDAHNNSGNIHQHRKRVDEAIACYDRVVAINPDYAAAHLAKGFALLSKQKLLDGWRLYEWRKRLPEPYGDRNFGALWDGSQDISGKTILVHFEQGLGDTIQFCRYLPCLEARGARVLFAAQKALRALVRSLEGDFELVNEYDPALRHDFHIPLMSLPLALAEDDVPLPSQQAYLGVDDARVERWKARLGGEGFKIGICWQGSRAKIDVGRSFPLKQFAPLAKLPGVRLISLHKGDGESQLQDLPGGMTVETLGDDFDAGPDAFLDTAAVMKCCDLVISSDTAVAHLAGALGVNAWIALKHVPDWRWFIDREDSPWYPSLRLFRQPSEGDWDGLFADIETQLRGLLAVPAQQSAAEHRAVDGSGSGSSADANSLYRAFLTHFMKSNGVKSVVDIGCGDWRFSKFIDWSGVDYTGIDVTDVVLQNTRAYGAANIRFLGCNAVSDDLPGADLLLMKDVLQHWSNKDIISFFPKLRNYRRALITNGFHPAGMARLNADIDAGGWRPIDIKAPPFNLPGDYIYWYPADEPKWVFLWRRPE